MRCPLYIAPASAGTLARPRKQQYTNSAVNIFKIKTWRKDTTSFLPTKKNGCEAAEKRRPIREVLLFLLDPQIIIPEENFTEQTGFFLLQVTFIWFGG